MKTLSSLLALLSLLSFLCGCRRSESAPSLEAGTSTRKARIFMISVKDGAVAGPEAGCGGKLTPIDVELPAPSPALEGSLEALLAAGDQYQSAGFYNALANSPLRLERVERKGGAARIFLAGYLELGGECDGSSVLSQLTETAAQFRDLERAEFFLDGKPLRELLDGRGT
ncbi:MAG TPA: hypothetical protein VGX68_09890 [Thermoanaerobaculia bacterium]|jgi:hypothetical protein|nr:hypothetical protein [Thermoanaerobaculia bacterium]